MEYQKITNLLDNIPDKVPRFITKKWIKIHVKSGGTYNTNKQIRFKTLMLRSNCVTTVMHILLLKVKLLLEIQIIMHMTKN